MRLLKLTLVFICFFNSSVFAQNEDRNTRVARYITKYKGEAIKEQLRVGIPAAITLAQGIHETNAGLSELATNANNHFGIKCKKDWMGETYTYTDDRPDECFRKYKSDLESYKDHSDYLRANKRYAELFTLSITDYQGWANGLKKAGYATNPRYAQLLIKTIEDNNLQEYTYAAIKKANNGDDIASGEVVPEQDAATVTTPKKTKMVVSDANHRYTVIKNTETPKYGQTVIVNGLKAFYGKKETGLLNDAIKYNMRYARLLDLNDLPDAPLPEDMFVYLERKNIKGGSMYHVVKPGETMHQIAQLEGMQLRLLKQYNRIKEDEEPVSGTLLNLQQMVDKKPEVYARKKEEKEEREFDGSDTRPVPQGTTRMKAGYITKAEIEGGTEVTTRKVRDEETNKTKTEVVITKPTEVTIDEDAIASENKVVKIEEETTTITPDKDVVVEKVTTTQSLENPDQPVVVEEEKTIITEDKKEVVVEKNTTVVPVVNEGKPEEPINIADTKAVEEEKPVVKEEEEEPKDEFARLKARLDKAVYASEKAKKQVAENKTEDAKPTDEKKKESSTPKPNASKEAVYYTVKKGDSAFAIAKKHNITMTQLKDWNKLDFSEIKVGQKLRVK